MQPRQRKARSNPKAIVPSGPFQQSPPRQPVDDEGSLTSMEISAEAKDPAPYRRDWESSWGGKFGSFQDYNSALLAARDAVDHNRNIVFRRGRDACQVLTEQDSLLLLTGPSRAIVFTDPVDVEIQLKVKGRTEPEDKYLISKVLVYKRDFGSNNSVGAGNLVRSTCSSEFCSLELTSAPLAGAVEATVISAELIQGRWPKNLGIRVVSGTASIDEDLVLLDARDGRFRVDLADGLIKLSRHIVCVEKDGGLKLSVEAYTRNGDIYEGSGVTVLTPKRFSASVGVCKLPFCTVQFTVGWSCLANVGDLMAYGI